MYMKGLCFMFVMLTHFVWIANSQNRATKVSETFDSNLKRLRDGWNRVPTRFKRSKDSTCKFSKNMDNCSEHDETTCCKEKECVLSTKNLKYTQATKIRSRKCTNNLSNWTACCQSCFDNSTPKIENNTEICDMFTSCKIEYREERCITSRKSNDNKDRPDQAQNNPQSRIIAFSIAGVVMIALLGFAAHSISHTREKMNFHFPKETNDGDMINNDGSMVVYHQNGGAPQYFYHPPNAYPRPNGRLFIGSTLSIIQEEEDVIVTETEAIPEIGGAQDQYHRPGDHSSPASPPSSSSNYSSASGEYDEVMGAIPFAAHQHPGLAGFVEESIANDEVTHIEIQDLDSVQDEEQYCLREAEVCEVCSVSSNDGMHKERMETNCVICDVHASPLSSPCSSMSACRKAAPNQLSNYSLGGMDFDMPEYDIASMSMYDITHTSPVRTIQRRISQAHNFQYVSMPDMTKATFTIPEIDELLSSSSSISSSPSRTTSNSSSLEYCLNIR